MSWKVAFGVFAACASNARSEDSASTKAEIPRKSLEQLHKVMDMNEDGQLTMQEVLTFADRAWADHSFRSKDRTMRKYDLNKNGEVDLDEVLHIHFKDADVSKLTTEQHTMHEHERELVKSKFVAADADKDGVLNENELSSLVYFEANSQMVAAVAQLSLKKGDVDGDGKLDENEFLHATTGIDAKSASESKKDMIKRQFKRVDADGDGKIDRVELEQHHSGLADIEVAFLYLFRAADTNEDLKLSLEEFSAHELGDTQAADYIRDWVRAAARSKIPRSSLEELHKTIDADKDGKVSMMEVLKFSEKTYAHMAERSGKGNMKKYDANQNGEVDLDEAMQALFGFPQSEERHQESRMSEEGKREFQHMKDLEKSMFAAADRNKDGVLSEEELVSLVHFSADAEMVKARVNIDMKMSDVDGDNKLDFTEYYHVMTANSLDKADPDDVRSHKKSFNDIDLDKNGKIDAEELELQHSGEVHLKSAFTDMFALGDIDNDNGLSAHEFARYHAHSIGEHEDTRQMRGWLSYIGLSHTEL